MNYVSPADANVRVLLKIISTKSDMKIRVKTFHKCPTEYYTFIYLLGNLYLPFTTSGKQDRRTLDCRSVSGQMEDFKREQQGQVGLEREET